jgi:hypothetical protein
MTTAGYWTCQGCSTTYSAGFEISNVYPAAQDEPALGSQVPLT